MIASLLLCLQTLAPSDVPVYPGWVATYPDLPAPTCVALEPDGSFWVGTSGDHRIRHIAASGAVQVEAGGRGTGPGQFRRPAGLALLPDAVAVSDGANDRVQLLSRTGEYLRTLGAGRLHRPAGLAWDSDRLLVADSGNDRVALFALDGTLLSTLGERGSGPGQLLRPSDVAVDGGGRVWVADTGNQRVVSFEPGGEPGPEIGTFGFAPGLFAGPSGLCARGRFLWVSDRDNHRVQLFDRDGAWQGMWGIHALRPREGQGKLHYPVALDVRPELGRALLAESRADRVQAFGPGSEDELRRAPLGATGTGAPAPGSIPHFGRGAAADGLLLVTIQPETQSIQVLDLRLGEPVEITLFGSFGDGPGRFRAPVDVAVDAARARVFVLDRDARRLAVFEIDYDPERELRQLPLPPRFVKARALEPLACEASLPHPVDPTAMARAADGRLFVADARNQVVLELGADLRLRRVLGRGAGRLAGLIALALSPSQDTLWAAAADEPAVVAFDLTSPDPEPSRRLDEALLGRPQGLAVRPSGELLVADSDRAELLRFGPDLALASTLGGPGLGALEFHRPGALVNLPGAPPPLGHGLVVIDRGNHRLQFLDPDLAFVRAFGARLYVRPTRTVR